MTKVNRAIKSPSRNQLVAALRILVLIIVAAAVLGSPYLLQREGFFRITEVDVNLREGSAPQIWLAGEWAHLRSESQKIRGQDLWGLDLDVVAQKIKEKKWVREVSITRSWPNRLNLSIEPKKMVALARGPKGVLLPILDDGSRLKPEQMSAFVSLPILTGEIKDELINDSLRLISLLPESGTLSRDRVSEVGYQAKEGFWILTMPFATKVRFGFTDFERKVSRVKQVMDYLDSRQIGARVIDADLSKKVVVRLRKTP